jgi:D-tyrosyl-tRNA(Tyr) deacylase
VHYSDKICSGNITCKISAAKFSVVSCSSILSCRALILLVSQFTLLASTKKGSKPDFHGALGGDQAKELYQRFLTSVQQSYDPLKVKDGIFQAMMKVALVNDGPVSWKCGTISIRDLFLTQAGHLGNVRGT